MNLLIKILQAAHCRSTHQFFVMDALPLVTSPRAERLRSILLTHHEAYLIGSKDPDKTFRDFRNHVLHVGDNNWGGATKAAENWYGKLQREMANENWQQAAYAAGVLSHYFTDPLMPLHTAQSEEESIIHRPLEWSVTKSYSRIFQRYQSKHDTSPFVLPHGDQWLSAAITRGATVAHSYYHELIQRYDLAAGCKNPPAGLDSRSIDILAKMFSMAITGWAQVIQRAADESRVAIPNSPLSLPTVLAALNMPSAWIRRRIESSEERVAVKAIFDEFEATGTVKDNLPIEVTSVRREKQLDLLESGKHVRAVLSNVVQPPPVSQDPIGLQSSVPEPTRDVLPLDQAIPSPSRRQQKRLPTLSHSDDLVDAPSIGPKTAKRFAKIGIATVSQFLAASADAMAADLDTNWITADKVKDWQAQAILVCEVASLCGYKSQLLVGVGCRNTATLAKQEALSLHELIGDFAKTSDGQRILRSSSVPKVDSVAHWISDANDWASRRKSA